MNGMIRQVYELVAVFAIINLAGIAGVAGYLSASGKLTAERARTIAAVLRGEMDEPTASGEGAPHEGGGGDEGSAEHKPDSEAHAAVAGDSGASANAAAEPSLHDPVTERELGMRERNRFDAEINQRLALANSIMLQVTTKLDALHSEMEAFEQKKQAERGLRDEEGFKKELEIFKTLKPAQAFDYLVRKDAGESARLLMDMDPRAIGAILQSAKTPETQKKADDILARMREVAPASASQVKTGGS